jgi:hypothetical protein
MRTSIAVAVAAVLVVAALAAPTLSQEKTRVAAMVDVTALAGKLDKIARSVEQLKEENAELKKEMQQANKVLEIIAGGVGILRVPLRWEYKFVKSRSEKLANRYGKEGWELSNIFEEDWFIYRRPLPPKLDDEKDNED